MKTQDIVPVVASVLVIILVAILEKQSKLIAAVTATMPLTAPLALWIVYASVGGQRAAVSQFSLGLLLGIVPTLAFLAAVWVASKAGLKLVPTLLSGYGVWGLGVALLWVLKRVIGLE